MPPKTAPGRTEAPLVLLVGDDEYALSARAKEIFKQWCEESGGLDQEIIDASAANAGEAVAALGKLRESLQTLPFFGGSKVIWFRNCNFLVDDRTSNSGAVTEMLGALGNWLKEFDWKGVKLLITARNVDKRRSFYKTLEKTGRVELFAGLTLESKDWEATVEVAADRVLKERGLAADDEALALLVTFVGPNKRLLANEIEKLALYCGGRKRVTREDVETIVSRNKNAKAFAVAEAVAERDLPKIMRTLDQELWSMQTDSQRNEIGLLYGIISKVRSMLLAKELVKEGYLQPGADYARVKVQVERIPPEAMPKEKKFNPAAMHPFVLFNSLRQSQKYTSEELVEAMQLLLDCNLKLVSSSTDEATLLQQALVKIAQPKAPDTRMKRKAGV